MCFAKFMRAFRLSTYLVFVSSMPVFAAETFCDSNFQIEEVYAETDTYGLPYELDELIKISDQVRYIEPIDASLEPVFETTIVYPTTSELTSVSAEWGWVEGEYPGYSEGLIVVPPEFEIETDTIIIRPSIKRSVPVPPQYMAYKEKLYMVKGPEFVEMWLPPVTQDVKRQKISKDGTRQKVKRKNIVRDGKTYKIIKPAMTMENTDPLPLNQAVRYRIKTPASTVERVLNEPLYKWVPKEIAPQIESLLLRNSKGEFLKEFPDRDTFLDFKAALSCEDMLLHFSGVMDTDSQ